MNTEQIQQRIADCEAELTKLREELVEPKPIDMVEEIAATLVATSILSHMYQARDVLRTILKGARDRYARECWFRSYATMSDKYEGLTDRRIAAVLGITVEQVQEWSA